MSEKTTMTAAHWLRILAGVVLSLALALLVSWAIFNYLLSISL